MNADFRLSVSKCKTFLNCKAQYNYSYNLKLPKKKHDYFIFGTFCHKVLEDFHNLYLNGSKDPYNVAMSLCFKQATNLYKQDMNPEMKKQCWEIINQYLKIITKSNENNKFPNIMACEKTFELNLKGASNIILNGMIDRVQLDDDSVIHVCDYKTVKNKKYLKNDTFQLLTYAYAILLEDPSIEKVRASYILLRHDFEHITVEFKPDEILKIKDKYLNYAETIMSEKEFAPNPTKLCEYCDYNDTCSAGRKMIDPTKIYGEVEW